MSIRANRRRRSGGFTLIEVFIALGVLAFGLLTLAIMQLQAISQGSKGRHTNDAASYARSYLEQVHRVPWTVLDAAQVIGTWTNPNWVGAAATANTNVDVVGGGGSATEHSYGVQWRVTDIGAAPVCLRDVEVRVTWQEEDMSNAKSMVLATRRYNWGDPNC